MIEQAIFTSRQTAHAAGYHLVARSRGLSDADAKALATWCPSHDALDSQATDAECFNFHGLPSGNWCLSRSVAAGSEYSARGGSAIYTQCLILDDDLLARFARQPLVLARALLAQGIWTVLPDPPAELPALSLAGKAAAIDTDLVADVVSGLGHDLLAATVEVLSQGGHLALVLPERPQRFLAAAVACLPLEARLRCTFTTGLRYSSRRPFLVHCWSTRSEELRHARRERWTVLSANEAGVAPRSTWGQLVHHCLARRDWETLIGAIGQSAKSVAAGAGQQPKAPAAGASAHRAVRTGRRDKSHATSPAAVVAAVSELAARDDLYSDPSQQLAVHCPRALQALEQLDDVVFEAIAGKQAALAALKQLWPTVLERLGPNLIEESKAQYLRHALAVWEHFNAGDDRSTPERGLAALEVIEVLLGDAAPNPSAGPR
ncbi:MAG: hypothetical protein K1X74_10695 [Pirellulales bacterium]|nr:hypothetical protein [Pirellulales bacterium]